LGEVAKIYQPKTITSKEIKKDGPFKVFGANGVIGYFNKYNHEEKEIAITCRGATCGTINMTEPKSWITGNAMVVSPVTDELIKDYLYYELLGLDIGVTISGSAQPQITRQALAPFEIKVPPLKIQQKIVGRLDAIRKAQELNDLQISRTHELFESIIEKDIASYIRNPTTFGEICTILSRGKTPKYGPGECYTIKSAQVYEPLRLSECPTVLDINSEKNLGFAVKKDDVLLNGTGTGTLGRSGYLCEDPEGNYIPDSHVTLIRTDKKKCSGMYLFAWLNSTLGRNIINSSFTGSTNQIELSPSTIKNFQIYLPPLSEQQKIVEKLNAVQDYKKSLLKQKSLLKELFNSVLQKSMKGEI